MLQYADKEPNNLYNPQSISNFQTFFNTGSDIIPAQSKVCNFCSLVDLDDTEQKDNEHKNADVALGIHPSLVSNIPEKAKAKGKKCK